MGLPSRPGPLGAVAACVAAAAVAFTLAVDRGDWAALGEPALAGPDVPFYLAVAARHADPRLYSRDDLLADQAALVPRAFSWLLIGLGNAVGEAGACRALWIAMNAALLTGLAALGASAGGWPAGALAAALTAAAFSHTLPGVLEWGMIPPHEVTPAGTAWASVGWLSWLALRAGTPARALAVGLGAAVVGSVHPLTGAHAAAVGVLACLIGGERRLARVGAVAAGAALWLAPFTVRYMAQRGSEPSEIGIVAAFAGEAAGWPAARLSNSALHLLPAGLLALWWAVTRRHAAIPLVKFAAAVAGVMAVGESTRWLAVSIPGLGLRTSWFLAAALYAGAGAALADACRRRPVAGLVAVAAALVVFAGGPGRLPYRLLKPLKDLAAGGRTWFPARVAQEDPVDVQAIASLGRWSRSHLPLDAYILAPPAGGARPARGGPQGGGGGGT